MKNFYASSRFAIFAGLLACLAVGRSDLAAAAEAETELAHPATGPFDLARVPWKRLEFEASKFVFTARCSVELTSRAADRLQDDLLAGVGGQPIAPQNPLVELKARTAFLGKASESQTILNAASGGALQHRIFDYKGRQRLKVFRFGRSGVYTLRLAPASSGEKGSGPEGWTHRNEGMQKLDNEDHEVTDPIAVLYAIAARKESEMRRSFSLALLTDNRRVPVTVTFIGEEVLKVHYRLGGQPAENRQVSALRYDLLIDAAADKQGVELLGLEGNISILFEAETRLPLEIRGKISPAGNVRVRLVAAEL